MVILALGSNLGDRLDNLRRAHAAVGRVCQASAIYTTKPRYVTEQPDFLNAALAVETEESPQDLLVRLKALETDMGRVPGVRFGARLIDLDIIYYHDRVIDTPDLMVPHPRRLERAFVMQPVADIAPDLVDPVTRQTVAAILAGLPDRAEVVRHAEQW